nr:MAG TPA: hypothetical protein [Caudoviricetes sp.]
MIKKQGKFRWLSMQWCRLLQDEYMEKLECLQIVILLIILRRFQI